MSEELWRDIPGFEEYYEVSSFGRVWRKPGTPKCRHGREIKPIPAQAGYEYVTLSVHNEKRRLYVNRLVMEAFCGLNDSDLVLHRDRNKSNNRLENLIVMNVSELRRELYAEGRITTPHKLSEDDVIRIVASNEDAQLIADELEISLSRVYQIRRRFKREHPDAGHP